MPEFLRELENSEIEKYEESSRIWRKEAKDLTEEELLDELRKDGMALIHRSYHGSEILALVF